MFLFVLPLLLEGPTQGWFSRASCVSMTCSNHRSAVGILFLVSVSDIKLKLSTVHQSPLRVPLDALAIVVLGDQGYFLRPKAVADSRLLFAWWLPMEPWKGLLGLIHAFLRYCSVGSDKKHLIIWHVSWRICNVYQIWVLPGWHSVSLIKICVYNVGSIIWCVCVLFVFHCDIGLVYYLVAVVFVFMLIYFCKWVKLNKFTKRGRGDEQMNKGMTIFQTSTCASWGLLGRFGCGILRNPNLVEWMTRL